MGQPASTKISEIHDHIFELVKSKLPDHAELRDNVVIENNSDKDLFEGYAISFGPSQPANLNLDCPLYIIQEITVFITQGNDGSDEDRELRKDAEKKILGHRDDIVKVSYTDNDVNGLATKFDFSGDNGIQDVFQNESGHAYLMIEMRFNLTYKDKIQ